MHKVPLVDTAHPLKMFLDLDGVFADFNKRVKQLTGVEPYQLSKNRIWAAVHSDHEFFLNLELMDDADKLWAYTKQYNPTFLTGAPSSHAFCEQKAEWVKRKFGHEWTTIVLPKKDKQLHSGHHRILIDDSLVNIEQWVSKGGYGILYTGDTDETIAKVEDIRKAYVEVQA